jgi:uncharacterized Zn finger protein
MPIKIHKVTCRHCGTEQETLVFRRDGHDLCYVCRECGQRNYLSDGEMRTPRRIVPRDST